MYDPQRPDLSPTPREMTGSAASAASAGYERRLEKADKDIKLIRGLYDEWRESKDEGLVTVIFTRAVSAINAATSL